MSIVNLLHEHIFPICHLNLECQKLSVRNKSLSSFFNLIQILRPTFACTRFPLYQQFFLRLVTKAIITQDTKITHTHTHTTFPPTQPAPPPPHKENRLKQNHDHNVHLKAKFRVTDCFHFYVLDNQRSNRFN